MFGDRPQDRVILAGFNNAAVKPHDNVALDNSTGPGDVDRNLWTERTVAVA
jgi:hypothetical protein